MVPDINHQARLDNYCYNDVSIEKEIIMSKIILFVLLALLLVGCVAEPAPPANTAIAQTVTQLPEDAGTLIFALVTAVVAWLGSKLNLGQYTQPLVAVIAPALITLLENFLGTIPTVWDNAVLTILHYIVLFVAGSIGLLVTAKRIKQPTTLLEG